MKMKYKDMMPNIHDSCFISESSDIIGNVSISKDASVWFRSVIRGDGARIEIGEETNIQDGCILHCDHETISIGKRVSVGHGAIVHGATIEDECLIGMHATILNGAHISKHCIVAANALVKENMFIPENSLVVGVPAKIIKTLDDQQIEHIIHNAKHYVELSKDYK